ncbi:hypothetical protein [Streptomyces sp. NPDC052179]|uniref:hypothetical protein n=1 Tax=Streptomyces sp. NPDC052179 TaxID=3155680 RepID=UPI00342DB36D
MPCAAPEPEPPVPPCCSPGLASTGLCLADGTPIAVLAVTACGDCGTDAVAPEVSGWLNLLTGQFTAGPPPVGAVACAGQPQQFEVGQWCDLDAGGEVIAPVLVEYEYDDTGQLTGVRTLTPGGDPYTVAGTLGICPGAVDDAEYVILCDTATDGSVTEFLRQLTPNGDGTSSTSDTLLDGTTAYTPVGRVGICGGSLVPCGTGTGGTPGVSGPITSGNEELSSVALSRPISPATEHEVPGMGALITGGTWHLPATKCGVQTSGQDHGLGALRLPAVPRPLCDAGTVQVTIRLTYAQEGPDVGQASTGALFLMYHQPDGSAVQAGGHAFPQNTPVGSTGVREVTASIPADRLAAGQVYAVVSAETWQKSFNVPPRCKAWTFSEWGAEFAYDVTGCPDVPPPPLAQLVKVCPTDPIPVTVEPGKDTEVAVLCDTGEDGTVTQFLRAYQVDSESGQVGVVADTLLDGTTPFEPLGRVGVCPSPEPCRDTATVLLCDAPATDTVTVEPAVTDSTPADVGQTQFPALPGPYTSLWTGGTLTFPADPGPAQSHRAAIGQFTASPSGCDDATGTITVSVRVTQLGPGTGQLWDGALRLFRGTTVLADDPVALYAPPGHVQTLTVSAPVTTADLVAGTLHVGLMLETFHGTSKSWNADQFNATVELTGCEETRSVQFLRTLVTDCETGTVVSTTDTTLDGDPYTVTGDVGQCEPTAGECCPTLPPETRLDTETSTLCIVDDATGDIVGQVLAVRVWDDQTGMLAAQSFVDPVTSEAVTIPAGAHLAPCPTGEPCRGTSSTLLCDTSATDLITVLDPANQPDADGWEVVSFTGSRPDAPPEAPIPYPARYGTPYGYPALGARTDQSAGYGGGNWAGYDSATVRWVLRKTFTAPEDGVAVAQSMGFRGDGGARVRINGVDAGMYGQWNQPATSGTAQIPVTAGPNTVEIEVRDVGGINNLVGRLDLALPRTVQFMRRQVTDCATGEVVATHDTTLDGDPYTVVGEVGQCEPVAECCEQPPPETRLDVETLLLCVRDTATGEVLDQVLVERVYDDQTGDLVEQRVTDPTTGDPVTVPAGAELARCPSPDRITRQVCVVSSGSNEFLTNAANATSGQDTDWVWSPNPTGPWYPMYRVSPNPLWTVTDPAPNKAHWVGPHADRTVCPTAGETSPPVPGTWYTRASWNLPVNVDPATVRIGASILNADNDVVQWRLNDGTWQPVAGGQLAPPAWSFPPTAVPGGRAGQNEIIVQILESQPAVTCPSGNSAGMILHVTASYDFEPRAWTQVIEDGRVYYLDENGDRQDGLLPGDRIVPCGGEGGCCPNCPSAFATECVKEVTNAWSYDNTSSSGSNCGSVQGPIISPSTTPAFPCAATGVPAIYQITSWIIDGVELVTTPLAFQNGPCGDTTGAGMHDHWAAALTQLDPSATWVVDTAPLCNWYVRSDDAPADRVYGTMKIRNAANTAQVWTLGPEHSYTESFYTKVFTQECDGTVSVKWLDAQGVETDQPAGPVVSCGGGGGEAGPDVELLELCDVDPVAGTVTPFLRALTYRDGLTAPTVMDTALDGITPYTVAGTVGACTPPLVQTRDVEVVPLCVLDSTSGDVVQEILAEIVYDETGARVGIRYVDRIDGSPVAMPGGTSLGVCPDAGDERPVYVAERCLCDDTTGDGIGDTDYVELVAFDAEGAATVLGTFTPDYEPYTPAAPVACDTAGADPATGVQARRVELAAGQTWDAADWPALQSVTAVARGAGSVTTADGTSGLVASESVTWSVSRDEDAALTGPLTIAATTGTVVVTWTAGVTL